MAENNEVSDVTSAVEEVNNDVALESPPEKPSTSGVQIEPDERIVAVGVEDQPGDDRDLLVRAADPTTVDTPEGGTGTGNATWCDRYTEWTKKLVDSRMMLIAFLPILIGLIIFMCMGSSYYELCPFYPHFPLMTIIMGVSGGFSVVFRILRILRSCRWQSGNIILRFLTNLGFLVFLVTFLLEFSMYAFSDGYPTATYGEDTYCDGIFYQFLGRSFVAVLVTLLLFGGIYAPLLHRFFHPLFTNENNENNGADQ